MRQNVWCRHLINTKANLSQSVLKFPSLDRNLKEYMYVKILPEKRTIENTYLYHQILLHTLLEIKPCGHGSRIWDVEAF